MNRLTVSGTPYHRGLQLGKKFSSQIRWRLQHHQIISQKISQHQLLLQKIYARCNKLFPSFIQEMRGMAQGSGSDFWHLFYLNCPELSQAHHGCSSIAVVDKGRASGKTLLAHNEDGDALERKDKCALIQYKLPHCSFSSYTYLGELPGNAYSWNSHGLFFAVNYVPVERNLPGIPYYFLTRALGEARTVERAVAMLKKNFCASGFHAFIGKGKRIVSLEMAGKKVSVQEVNRISFHTNHFIHPGMRSEIRQGSSIRFKRLQELLIRKRTKIPPERRGTADSLTGPGAARLRTILSDRKNRPYPLYSMKGDRMRTLSTVIFTGRRKVNKVYKRYYLL